MGLAEEKPFSAGRHAVDGQSILYFPLPLNSSVLLAVIWPGFGFECLKGVQTPIQQSLSLHSDK